MVVGLPVSWKYDQDLSIFLSVHSYQVSTCKKSALFHDLLNGITSSLQQVWQMLFGSLYDTLFHGLWEDEGWIPSKRKRSIWSWGRWQCDAWSEVSSCLHNTYLFIVLLPSVRFPRPLMLFIYFSTSEKKPCLPGAHHLFLAFSFCSFSLLFLSALQETVKAVNAKMSCSLTLSAQRSCDCNLSIGAGLGEGLFLGVLIGAQCQHLFPSHPPPAAN